MFQMFSQLLPAARVALKRCTDFIDAAFRNQLHESSNTFLDPNGVVVKSMVLNSKMSMFEAKL